MNRSDEFTDVLESYLEEYEGSTPLPDPIRDALMASLPETRQLRRPWPLLHITGPATIALTSAAVVLALVLGVGLISRPSVGGPVDSAEPSASPEPTERLADWAGAALPARRYLVDAPFPVRVSMTIPDGFHAFGVDSHLAAICTNRCERPDRSGVAFWVVTNVYTDPCRQVSLADPPVGPGVDDLVTALLELPRREATEPVEVPIGGIPATYLELIADQDTADCPPQGFWAWAADTETRQSPPGDHDRIWVLDVGGTRLMVNMVTPSDASATEIAVLEEIVASIRFEGP